MIDMQILDQRLATIKMLISLSQNDLLIAWNNANDIRTKATILEKLKEFMSVTGVLGVSEMPMRKLLVMEMFPQFNEGTNTYTISPDFVVKAVRKIDRTLDPANVREVMKELREHGCIVDNIIDFEPVLKVKEYRKMTAEERIILSKTLTEKDQSPSIEFIHK